MFLSINIYNAFSVPATFSTPYTLQCFLISTVFFHLYPKLSGINQIVSLDFVVCMKVYCLFLQCPGRPEPFRCVCMMPHSPHTAMKMKSKRAPEGSMRRVTREESFCPFERCWIGKVIQLGLLLICHIVACRWSKEVPGVIVLDFFLCGTLPKYIVHKLWSVLGEK